MGSSEIVQYLGEEATDDALDKITTLAVSMEG